MVPDPETREPDGTAIGEPEPWAPWESRLCLWSLVLGIASLVVLAFVLRLIL